MKQVRKPLVGWGRVPCVQAEELQGRDLEEITRDVVLTRGLGRSYGDASLPPAGQGPVACSVQADRVLSFDESSGVLRAEAGLGLGRLADFFLPRGFFVPVSPGTRDVTLGGMVAADVHGKNHHVAGTIGAHVRALRMRRPDGSIEEVADAGDSELLRATLGGMGLTGHVLDVTLQLEAVPSRRIVEEEQTFSDFESLVEGLVDSGRDWPFTVAWSDLLAPGGRRGRGILLRGRWARPDEASAGRAGIDWPRLDIPVAMPPFVLTDRSVGAFNTLRYERARRRGPARATGAANTARVRDAESFFWPLDVLRNWNLLYGRRGFTQYQCVLPHDAGLRSYLRLLDIACNGGPGPFLAVIKDCGDEGKGMLSFPMPGLSFALDFPVHAGTPDLVARLNEVVAEAGGRIYLAKDAFTTAAQLAAMEPRLPAFLEARERLDPDHRLDSALARRLFPRS